MGRSRQEVDLELALRDPKQARKWIEEFNLRLTQPLTCIVLDKGWELERTIHFNTMTDDEAVEVAWHLLQDFEVRREVVKLKIARDLNEVH
jgi:hypothetical protein